LASKAIRIEVKGLRELGALLKDLDADIQKKIARAATMAGAAVTKKRAIEYVRGIARPGSPQTDTHFIADNIIVRRATAKEKRELAGQTSTHILTVRHKGKIKHPREDVNPYAVGIFNEFGTVKMGPWPFMRPAFESTKREALDAIVKRLQQRIEKANKAK
jgi:HK97 gp10 family phage protein